MNELYKKLGISQKQLTLSTQQPRQKEYNAIYNNIVHEPNYNFMADLLQLPKTAQGFKYLLVVVDLASNRFDIEPLKAKTSEDTLKAYQKMIKRSYISLAKGTIRTDGGPEFKSVFNQFLETNNIIHRTGLPNRHKQSAVVENLNKTLSKVFMSYITGVEEHKGIVYNEWTDILTQVRKELNKIRERPLTPVKSKEVENEAIFDIRTKQTYQVGDYVYEKLDWSEDALGKKQPTPQVRQGDYTYSRKPKRIIRVLLMNDKPYYRYLLNGIPNASYSDKELKPLLEEDKYLIQDVLYTNAMGDELYSLVHWKGETKRKATYLLASEIHGKAPHLWSLIK